MVDSTRPEVPAATISGVAGFWLTLVIISLIAPVAGAAPESGPVRFVEQLRVAPGQADWLSLHSDRIAFGAGRQAFVAGVGPTPRLLESMSLDSAVFDAVLVEDRLYVLGEDGVRVTTIGDGEAPSLPIALTPAPRGALHLSRMDDYLVIVEDGFGVRLVQMTFHDHDGMAEGCAPPANAVHQAGIVPIDESFTAVGSSFRHVYLATGSGAILSIDATDPLRPVLAAEVEIDAAVDAIAARGTTAFALSGGRLLIVDFAAPDGPSIVGEQPLEGGRSLASAGRALYAAAGERGLVVLRDVSAAAATIPVTVGDNFFQPANVAANVGDTVVWQKGTIGLHSVEACDGVGIDPAACSGNVSPDGSWSSGAPTSTTFTFQHRFNAAGTHRYFCAVHTALGMNGAVVVAAAAPSPPVVPDGGGGMPLLVGKLDATGTSLEVSWDDTTCEGTPDHHLIYGGGSSLPTALGGTYAVSGAQCAVGATSPFAWTSPDPTIVDPGGLLWFLVVADDGIDTEGSWGDDSAGGERTGPGPGGGSATCGLANKDLTNVCGQ